MSVCLSFSNFMVVDRQVQRKTQDGGMICLRSQVRVGCRPLLTEVYDDDYKFQSNLKLQFLILLKMAK